MVDSVGSVVEKFGVGEDFGKRGFNFVEEFFAGDTLNWLVMSKKMAAQVGSMLERWGQTIFF
jgi:hypothetical protein